MIRRTFHRWTAAVALSATTVVCGPRAASAQETSNAGHKSPALALVLSVAFPGAGQVYNGQYLKAGIAFGGAVVTSGAILLTLADVLDLDDDTPGTGTQVLGAVGVGVILWSWLDAPLSARSINRRVEAAGVAMEVGPRLRIAPTGRSVDLSVFRVGF